MSIGFFSACNLTYYSNSGYIRSPNFPSNYPNNAKCYYGIMTSDLSSRITFYFQWFNLEPQSNCTYCKLPGLHISHKDRMFAIMFFELFRYDLVAMSLYNGRKYWSFTRNICNRYYDSFNILFEASSQTCSAMVTTIWRPGWRALSQAFVVIYTYIYIFVRKDISTLVKFSYNSYKSKN